MRIQTTKKPGYVLLLSVLIVGAVGIAITTALLTIGISSLNKQHSHINAQGKHGA